MAQSHLCYNTVDHITPKDVLSEKIEDLHNDNWRLLEENMKLKRELQEIRRMSSGGDGDFEAGPSNGDYDDVFGPTDTDEIPDDYDDASTGGEVVEKASRQVVKKVGV